MPAKLRDRITLAALVLVGGAEAIDSDYAMTIALVLVAVADEVARRCADRHRHEAIARAAAMAPDSKPCANRELSEAIDRAGLSVQCVAEQTDRFKRIGSVGPAPEARRASSGPGAAGS